MSLYYFDTSAIVKYYHNEDGSLWIQSLLDSAEPGLKPLNRVYTAELAIAESAAAFAILARTTRIQESVRDAIYQDLIRDVQHLFQTLHVTRNHINIAADLTQRHPLKGYDAVHLAVALEFAKALDAQDLSLIFVTSDNQLLTAARSEALPVENPLWHIGRTPSDESSQPRSQNQPQEE